MENEGRRRKKQKKRKKPLTMTDACERNCPIGIGNEQKNFDVPWYLVPKTKLFLRTISNVCTVYTFLKDHVNP